MTIPRDDARTIFDRAVEHTRGLSPATFDQWFGGVQFDDLTDGVLTLRVQNEFVLEWVKANFLPTLAEKIRALSGWSVQVAWTVDPHLASPVSVRSMIQPVRPRAIALRPATLRPITPPSVTLASHAEAGPSRAATEIVPRVEAAPGPVLVR